MPDPDNDKQKDNDIQNNNNDNNQDDTQNNNDSTSAVDGKTDGSQGGKDKVPYDRFKEVIEEKNEYKNELEDLREEIENIEDPEELRNEYESRLEEINQKYVNRQKEYAVKEKALAEGVNREALDDFVQVANLDRLEVDEDNNEVQGVEDLVSDMKDSKSYFFNSDNSASSAGDDYKGGSNDSPITLSDIDNMTEEEINNNWDEVQKVLENQ